MAMAQRRDTVSVQVGGLQIGGGAPILVQSMTNTNSADAEATARQICELAEAGSEIVRLTVNNPEAAAAVAEIRQRVRDEGVEAPLIGDFHYNGHRLLADFPDCAEALDKYRINPGNVGSGATRDENFSLICKIAKQYEKPVRIGVNAGSLNETFVMQKMQENTDNELGLSSEEVISECMILSALQSTEMARECGLSEDQIIISCKCSKPTDLINVYRELSERTRQPLHLGLTEAGMGLKGVIWSTAPMAMLLAEGIGDTIRISLTPPPGGDRREEVYACCELLQSLGLRAFQPSITACPGCGRTNSTVYQELAEEIQAYVRVQTPIWRGKRIGFENLTLAVMGCIVNGPGESKAANIGISLPGAGESPKCPVYVDGSRVATLSGTPDELARDFKRLIDEYVDTHYPATQAASSTAAGA